MLRRLWSDEGGAILSAELILLMVILVIGISVGLVAVRDAVDSQLVEVALSIAAIDTSFQYDGLSYEGLSGGPDTSATVAGAERMATFNVAGGTDVTDVLSTVPATEDKMGYITPVSP